jgi:hypothetical protein
MSKLLLDQAVSPPRLQAFAGLDNVPLLCSHSPAMPYTTILFLLLLSICISFGHSKASTTALSEYYHQYPLLGTDDAPVSSSYRSPFPTFANIQHIDCYSAVDMDIKRYDIAIIGAPFDTGTIGRPGARFGPYAIRRGSRRINAVFGYSLYTHKNSLREWAQILDCSCTV